MQFYNLTTLQAYKLPKKGKIYIHATDTCYGFAARWDDKEAIEMIQQIKGRTDSKPFSLLFSSLKQAEQFCQLDKKQKNFITEQTASSSFIVSKKAILRDYFPAFDTVSIRIETPHFPVLLSSILKHPVTSTSANKSGKPPLYDSQEIQAIFGTCDDTVILIDSGTIPKNPPSTIWDLTITPYKKVR